MSTKHDLAMTALAERLIADDLRAERDALVAALAKVQS